MQDISTESVSADGVVLEGMTSISAVINGIRAGIGGRTIRCV
jgi:hypothetical protein